MARNSCELVKISLPGADAIGILYPDNQVLFFRGKKAARLIHMRAIKKMCQQGSIRELQREFPNLAESCSALGIKLQGPCLPKIDVLTEKEESALGPRSGYAGISLKKFDEGTVIPAIASRGDIYFRKGDSIVCLEDFIEAARKGYIIASRLEPDFDWDGEDEAPAKAINHGKKKAALVAKKNSYAATQEGQAKILQALR